MFTDPMSSGTDIADNLVLEPDDLRPEPRVLKNFPELREALHVRGVQRVHLGLRLLERGARLEPSDHLPVIAVSLVVRFLIRGKRERRPEAHFGIEKQKVAGHHSHDGVHPPVDPQLAAEYRLGPTEELLPEPAAQDGFALISRLAFFVGEGAAQLRLHPQQPEE